MAKWLENSEKVQKNVLWVWTILAASFFSLQLVSADWNVLQQGKLIFNLVLLPLTDAWIPGSAMRFLIKQMRQQNLQTFHRVLCTISLGDSKTNRLLWEDLMKKDLTEKCCFLIGRL